MSKPRDELKAKLDALETRTVRGNEKGVQRQHEQGKLTARERIARLIDDGTFVEEFLLAESPATDFGMAERKKPGDGVITGYGKVNGRLTYVFAQDFTSFAGTVGSVHAEKIAYTIQSARKVGRSRRRPF